MAEAGVSTGNTTISGIAIGSPVTGGFGGIIYIDNTGKIAEDRWNDDNFFLGDNSGNSTLTGNRNFGFGNQVLSSLTSGSNCCGFGFYALHVVTTGQGCGFGTYALQSLVDGTGNNGFGLEALYAVEDGDSNCAFGNDSLADLESGDLNSGFGHFSLIHALDSYNSAFGGLCLASLVNGQLNSGFGYKALYSLTNGSGNLGLGNQSLLNTDADDCIGIGELAGQTNVSGEKLILIGNSSDVGAANLSNAVAIGYGAVVSASNTMVFGGSTPQTYIFDGLGIQVGNPTGGDKGNGTINAEVALYAGTTIGFNNFAGRFFDGGGFLVYAEAANEFIVDANTFSLKSTVGFGWSSGDPAAAGQDTILARGGAGIMALVKPGGAAEFQVFGDGAKHTSVLHDATDGVVSTSSGDLKLSPAGVVRFGAHSAIGAEALSGYVTIKTGDGVTRKLAVVS